MTRVRAVRWATIPGLLLVALFWASGARPRSANVQTIRPPAKPNILLLAIDDLNDWIGCLKGHPQVKTPNLDRLAARGLLFANAHTQAPLCNPSRVSLLTGIRPSTTGVYALQPKLRKVGALTDAVTLPQYLERNGYRTFGVGKIFHDNFTPEELAREFDEWGAVEFYKNTPARKFVATPDPIKLMDWGPFPERDEDHDDSKVADWAIERLKAKHSQPFFLAAGIRLPHVPLYVPQKWYDLYPEDKLILPTVKDDDRDDVPEFAWYLHWKLPEPRLSWLRASHQWGPMVRGYLASISFMDAQVGRILDTLESNGLAGNTIVVLFSDHGWHLGEKGISGKNTLWERSTHVPLIFAGPGVPRGARSDQPVELLDLYPTLAELSGLHSKNGLAKNGLAKNGLAKNGLAKNGLAKNGLEGHSLVPLLRNPRAKREWPAITTHNRDNHAVRSERWRYIRYADGSEELYDHRRDPNEWTNLARDARYAKVIAEHRRWLPKVNAPPVPGSAARLLVNENGVWIWEGKPIRKEEKQP
jgi:choline-sulfatase